MTRRKDIEIPPCPECGKAGYVPWDAVWAIRCRDSDCKLWQPANVLTRKEWLERSISKAKGEDQ